MLYDFLAGLSKDWAALNVFRYITFRTGGATLTALLISFLFGPRVIAMLKVRQRRGQPFRPLERVSQPPFQCRWVRHGSVGFHRQALGWYWRWTDCSRPWSTCV